MTTNEIAAKILERHIAHKPLMIAIEGYGGSGKSTFANALKKELGSAYVVNIDDFIIKNKTSDSTKSNFDRKRLEKQILIPLRRGLPAAYQRLEWETDNLSKPIPVPEVSYLIVEGVSSSDPSIEDYYDIKIWVETPVHIAKERGSRRDKELGTDNDNLWEHWTATYSDYKNQYRPDLKADFIFDNSRSSV